MRSVGVERTDGVTNVVSMIMITAIIISFMGMVFSTYMPAWGKDIEAQTLNNVMDSFMDLKSGLDTLSVGGDPGTSMTTKMTLGSRGGPVFGFGRMTGSLSIEEEMGQMSVSGGGFTYGQSRGTILYRSDNLYVEDQDILLEGGAIIRDQGDSSVLKGPPNIMVDMLDKGEVSENLRVYVLLQNIQGTDVGFSGAGSYMISSSLLVEESSDYALEDQTITIVIHTEQEEVWQKTIDDMLSEESLSSPGDYVTVYDANTGTFTITIYNVDSLSVKMTFFRVTMT
ncbi:MAG: hypothetical protein JXA22_09075 [Candidatus Thermoplasmatota archaeon]|nr:hypothetical protein [Candidatus Thermoplasmatota archaeon]